jgi:hypothetical protein
MPWYIFCVTVLFSVLLYSLSVLLYSSVLLCCSLLFILLCSSSCYVCVLDCIYCTLTLPPGVNPIAVNKYLSIYCLFWTFAFYAAMSGPSHLTSFNNPKLSGKNSFSVL